MEPGARGRGLLVEAPAGARVAVAVAVGLSVGIALALTPARWPLSLLIGWVAAAAVFVTWAWIVMWPMTGAETRGHARREDASRPTSDLVILFAAVASLGAVAAFLAGSGTGGVGRDLQAALSVLGVALAWGAAHTVFAARYARLYYADPVGGVDFNEESEPRYRDFVYLALNVGMTFQVSDTDITQQETRDAVVRHMLLSYLLGAVVIATTINLVAGLAH